LAAGQQSLDTHLFCVSCSMIVNAAAGDRAFDLTYQCREFNNQLPGNSRGSLSGTSVYSVACSNISTGNSLGCRLSATLRGYQLRSKSQTMEKLYSQITEQARHEYTLAYVPRGNIVLLLTTRGSTHDSRKDSRQTLSYYTPRSGIPEK